MNIVLLDASEVGGDGRVSLSGTRAKHLTRVLKVAPGSTVRLGIIDGPMGVGTVAAVGADDVGLQCVWDAETPERPRVDVLLAVPRPKVLRRLWAQLAALGVGRVILTNAEKVERDYFDSHVMQEEGFRPLLIEGLQQARDTRVPQVSVHKRFTVLVEDELDTLCPDERRLVAHPDSAASMARALGGTTSTDRVLVAVGPEGGWNDFELALLARHRFERVGLGPRTLATTTACVALLTLAHHCLAEA
jgi:16S rRNA (uracil1498-N3)-methyltransferase